MNPTHDDIPPEGVDATLPFPAELAPLIASLRAGAGPIDDTIAAAHIAGAAAAARATVAAAAPDGAANPVAPTGADAAGSGSTTGSRRRTAAIVTSVVTLATGALAAAALTRPGDRADGERSADPIVIAAGDGEAGTTAATGARSAANATAGSTGAPTQAAGAVTGDPAGPGDPAGSTVLAPPATDGNGNPVPTHGPSTTTAATAITPGGPSTTARPPVVVTTTTTKPTTTTTAPPAGPVRLLALGKTICGLTVNLPSSGASLVVAGATAANCAAGNAVSIVGGSSLTTDTLSIVGGLTGGGVNGIVRPNQPATADPFAGLPSPSGGTPRSGGDFQGAVTLQPGVYTGTINIKSGGDVTLAPGVYDVSGFTVQGTGKVRGTGVVIHNRSGAIHVDSCSSVSLSAPTSGTYAGFTFVQPASNNTDLDLKVGAGCAWSVAGNLYAPRARLGVSGTLALTRSRVVVDSVALVGGTALTITG